jgi:hypothetical protein
MRAFVSSSSSFLLCLAALSPRLALAQDLADRTPLPSSPTATAPAATAPVEAPPPPPPGYVYRRANGAEAVPVSSTTPESAPSPKAVQYRWTIEASARTVRLSQSGYEPYTTDSSLATAAFGAYYGIHTQDRLSLHVGGEWSVGGLESTARGAATSLTVHRFAPGLIGRFRVTRWLYPAVRVAPFAQYTSASITPDSSPSRFDAKGFAFGGEATAGLHFVPFTIGDVDWPKARIWIFAEGGFSFVTKREMTFDPHQADDDPRRLESLHLPDLSTTGYVSRFGLAVSF